MALSKELLSLQKKIPADQVLFSENDLTRDLYVLLKGKVEVVQKGIHLANIDKPGSFFGEMALLSGQPRSATLRTKEESIMLHIPPENIQLLMKQMPDLVMKIAKNLATTVGNLNKELLKAREALSFYELLKEEMDESGSDALEEVFPRVMQKVQQAQSDNMLEVAKSYLKSQVFIDPFMQSLTNILKMFYNHKIKVNLVESGSFAPLEKICGVDFTGAMSGSFIFMAPPERLLEIGKKLFGEETDDSKLHDTLMECAVKIIQQVRKAVPGLNLELASPVMIEELNVSEENFVGVRIDSDVGFLCWVVLNQ